MKSTHQQRVDEFMRRAGQDLPAAPMMPDASIRLLRARLIIEEALETVEALGCYVSSTSDGKLTARIDVLTPPDMVKAIDGCCDLSVVTIGTLSALGCPDEPFMAEVDAANLRKFEGDACKDSHGKWLKPTGFVPPDIAGVLAKMQPAESVDDAE